MIVLGPESLEDAERDCDSEAHSREQATVASLELAQSQLSEEQSAPEGWLMNEAASVLDAFIKTSVGARWFKLIA